MIKGVVYFCSFCDHFCFSVSEMEVHEEKCSSRVQLKRSWLDCGEAKCRRHTNRVDHKYCRKCQEILVSELRKDED